MAVCFAFAVASAACGQTVVPRESSVQSDPPAVGPTATRLAMPTQVPDKPGPPEAAAFAGWLRASPAISIRHFGATNPTATIWVLEPIGWRRLGEIPALAPPVSDGRTVAAPLDPEGDDDIAILRDDGTVTRVRLPSEPWAQSWHGIHGVVPMPSGGGFLLGGAGAAAIVNDDGNIEPVALPRGYVALAPTADPEQFLLASDHDGDEPGALSGSTPFAVYVWRRGDVTPSLVREGIVAVRPSTIGLAWLQTGDGAWWSLARDRQLDRMTDRSRIRSEISPDGGTLVFFDDSIAGCDTGTADPCQVRVVDETGSVRPLVGPAVGIGFAGDQIALVLQGRPEQQLPWRLVHGAGDRLETTPIN